MIGPYLLEMIVEVKKAFINFLRINSDSNLPDPLNNSLSTSSHENTHINGHNYSCSVNKNSGIRIDECNKDSYRCRRSFKGLTISDSLDLATNRTQSSLYSNLPPESIELDLICADKIFSNKGSSRNGHLFCPVPLDGDTFCDHCNQPIWELGWRPVCFKCAKCHMTCHWLCKDEVAVVCDDDAKTIKHASEIVPLFRRLFLNIMNKV
ncbi:hypothetical protein EWB00_008735 [Schistosoma japonicum]|uniref:Phorbol-ester/DAG-type domain-containing protein n=1 Tax=Schistosoma japonicum TaxID=6182 RepID=A0A4Z2DSR0_SCHJA|nr:hypothetical protein EWB00_008735 [Schistosoma japonicum]